MKVFTAPNAPEKGTEAYDLIAKGNAVEVFLAGGITNCKNWQKAVIDELGMLDDSSYSDLIIYNPRQENFDVSNKNASYDQIAWEYHFLNRMNLFCMCFVASESVQPICMYELGRYISEMQRRFPSDWTDRIIIFVEDGYKRKLDVLVQVYFAIYGKIKPIVITDTSDVSTEKQIASEICKRYRKLSIYNTFYRLKSPTEERDYSDILGK